MFPKLESLFAGGLYWALTHNDLVIAPSLHIDYRYGYYVDTSRYFSTLVSTGTDVIRISDETLSNTSTNEN